MIVDSGTNALAAAVVDAPRTEWALKIWLSIPAALIKVRSQRPKVVVVTGLWGRLDGYVIKLELIVELHIKIRFWEMAVFYNRKQQSNALNAEKLFLTLASFSRRETTAVLAKHRAKALSHVARDSNVT